MQGETTTPDAPLLAAPGNSIQATTHQPRLNLVDRNIRDRLLLVLAGGVNFPAGGWVYSMRKGDDFEQQMPFLTVTAFFAVLGLSFRHKILTSPPHQDTCTTGIKITPAASVFFFPFLVSPYFEARYDLSTQYKETIRLAAAYLPYLLVNYLRVGTRCAERYRPNNQPERFHYNYGRRHLLQVLLVLLFAVGQTFLAFKFKEDPEKQVTWLAILIGVAGVLTVGIHCIQKSVDTCLLGWILDNIEKDYATLKELSTATNSIGRLSSKERGDYARLANHISRLEDRSNPEVREKLNLWRKTQAEAIGSDTNSSKAACLAALRGDVDQVAELMPIDEGNAKPSPFCCSYC